MDTGRIVTYSLLAQINNTGIGIHDFGDIFVPLIKRVLSKMNEEGYNQGKHVSEIKARIDNTYLLDVPYPFLERVLRRIANEVNKGGETKFELYLDGSFQIRNFVFADYEEMMRKQEREVKDVEELYHQFLQINNIDKGSQPSIFEYIDRNRASLSKYFAQSVPNQSEANFSHQARFLNTFKDNSSIYGALRKIYLGSIISAYLEFKTEGKKTEPGIEFVLDTNFLIGLLDLTTIESTHTCAKIVDICKRLGYRLSVLDYTIEETRALLERTAEQFEGVFIAKKINPESIYNACDRRKLSRTDLQRISTNLEKSICEDNGLYIVPETTKFRNEAKYSKEYEMFKKMRINEWSARHDATAVKYVQYKRGKRVKDFFDAKCWFVTNPHHEIKFLAQDGFVPEIIGAEDLVNILWLTNPSVKDHVDVKDLSEIGITRLVSSTLNATLPNARIVKELDENIQKYAKDNISDVDIIRVSKRIAKKTNENLVDALNKAATRDPAEFVRRLEEEAKKGEREEMLFEQKLKGTILGIKRQIEERASQREGQMRTHYEEREERLRTEMTVTLANEITKKDKEFREALISHLQNVLKPLKKTKDAYEDKATTKANLYLGLIVIVPLVLAVAAEGFLHMNLSNSIIPPVVLYAALYFYFVWKKKEWSLKEMWKDLKKSESAKYYTRFNFDVEEFNRIEAEITRLQREDSSSLS